MQDELKPIYAVGDRVLLSNPFDLFDCEDSTVYTIEDVQFNEKYFTHFYLVNNRWVNEAWLELGPFGPQFLDEEVGEVKLPKKIDIQALKQCELLKLDLDYELASLHHAKMTQNATEIQRSKARLFEIQHELEALE